ncbi:hypothetical protein LLG46_08150 [bacterium]|nr:hypothetical protein [bacterium]
MKLVYRVLLFGIVFAIGIVIGGYRTTHHIVRGNSTNHHIVRANGGSNSAPVFQGLDIFKHKQYVCFKYIAYEWIIDDKHAANIRFERVGSNKWQMMVRGPSKTNNQPEDTVWGPEWSSCSKEECLRMMDRSLSDFRAIYPHDSLHLVKIETHVIRDLWVELLSGMRRTVSTLDGTVSHEVEDTPPEVDNEVQRILDESSTTRAIRALLDKHGMKVRSISGALGFKESLAGQKWSHVAKLRDVGVYGPNFIVFSVDP